MKQLTFLQSVPSDAHYCWETELQITNFIRIGYDPKSYRALVFIPHDRLEEGIPDHWKKLQQKFPECNIFFYEDTDNILDTIIRKINYIPYLRLWMLEKHFTEFPELEKDAIFYWDSDVLFTKKLDFTPFLEDNICYLSNTSHYLNLAYLDGKIEESPMRDELRKLRPIDGLFQVNGIDRQIVERNNEGTGGAQYLLKNINAEFWKDCQQSCRFIRPYLMEVNKQYFESENAGYQSWCADMWAVLWNLWKRGKETKCPTELDFAWATDPISRLEDVYLYHNAGVASTIMKLNNKDEFLFNKSLYKGNDRIPYKEEDNLKMVTKDYCTNYYTQELLNLNNTIF